MPEALRSWIMSLAGVIVFGSVCEMILPGGAYKKYVQLAIGLILVMTVVRPFTEGGFSFEPSIAASAAYEQSLEMDDRQRADILKIYKQRLCDKITAEIKGVAGVDFTVRCDVTETEQSFGSIEKIIITADASAGVKINPRAIELLEQNYGLSDEDIDVKYIDDK